MDVSTLPLEDGTADPRSPTPEQIDAFLAATDDLVADREPGRLDALEPVLFPVLFALAMWGTVSLAQLLRAA